MRDPRGDPVDLAAALVATVLADPAAARQSLPAGRRAYLPFFFGFSRCESAEPAAVFEASPVRPSRSTLDAALAAFGDVVFFAAIWSSGM